MALLPALAAERVREPGLAYALLARPTVVRTVCIIRHKEYPLSPASQALIRAIHDYLRTATLPAGCKRVREIPGRPKPEPGLSQ
ncbi:hypothetical protein D3C87_1922320 [compost metagenome]